MKNKEKTALQSYGEMVKEHRVNANFTQKELAQKIGITHEWVCKIEKGKANAISTSLMDKISKALDMNVSFKIVSNS